MGSPYRTAAPVFAPPPPPSKHPCEGRRITLLAPSLPLVVNALAAIALPILLVVSCAMIRRPAFGIVLAVFALLLGATDHLIGEVHRIEVWVRDGTLVVYDGTVTRRLPPTLLDVQEHDDGTLTLDREGWVRIDARHCPFWQRRALLALLEELGPDGRASESTSVATAGASSGRF